MSVLYVPYAIWLSVLYVPYSLYSGTPAHPGKEYFWSRHKGVGFGPDTPARIVEGSGVEG